MKARVGMFLAATADAAFVKANENGVRLSLDKRQGSTEFFKIVVSDVGKDL